MSARPVMTMLASLLLVACAAILGIRETPEKPFEHRAHTLEGVNCLICHQGVSEAKDLGPMHLPETNDCVTCHEQPHNPNTCSNCHGSHRVREQVLLARRHLKFEHAKHNEAVQGKCVRCHLDVGKHDGPLRPAMAICFGCHEHKDQWRVEDCDGCHVDLEVERVLPRSHVIHGPDFLREHGVRAASEGGLCSSCHSDRSCAACHGLTVPALPSRFHFAEPERADMHRAGFASRHALEARTDPAMCVTCHTESSCQGCHEREGVWGGSARSPHPPGWVGLPGAQNAHGKAARLDPVSCASCHGGAGEQLCVDCHRVGGPGGNPHPPDFASHKAKSDQPCRMCHVEAL